MIVVYEPDGTLVLIRQSDHAATCAQLARAWRRPSVLDDGVWDRFVEAVARHDEGWHEAEQYPVLDHAGQPLDFKTIPEADHVAIWRRSIEQARAHDPLAGLLIAMHARTLYTRFGQDTPEDERVAQAFVDEMTGLLDELLDTLSQSGPAEQKAVDPENLQIARRLLSFYDGLSLALAGGIEWFHATEPLSFDDRVEVLSLHREKDDHILVEPWPLIKKKVTLTAKALRLHVKRFKYAADLAHQMDRADRIELKWTLVPG